MPGAQTILKGFNPDVDSYSAFFDNQKVSETELRTSLTDRGVTDVFVAGLATDYCVGFTALHSLELGFRTSLITDCSRHSDVYLLGLHSSRDSIPPGTPSLQIKSDILTARQKESKSASTLMKTLISTKYEGFFNRNGFI